MVQVRIDFAERPTLHEMFEALDTTKGNYLLAAVEERFASVDDLLGHTTYPSDGAMVHFGGGDTVFFEHVPRREFIAFAHDAAKALGLAQD
jgi:hypothetical protein